jgi:hypothetical protein
MMAKAEDIARTERRLERLKARQARIAEAIRNAETRLADLKAAPEKPARASQAGDRVVTPRAGNLKG